MTYPNGFIRVHRNIRNWEWYDDPNTLATWIHLLINANWDEEKTWRDQVIGRGEIITSIAKLSAEIGISQKQLRTCLQRLTKGNKIVTQRANEGTKITICNYDDYMVSGEQVGQTKGKAEGKARVSQRECQRATYKEYKEIQEDKEKKDTIVSKEKLELPYNSDAFVQTWRKLIATKKWSKKPISALQVSLKRLADYEEPFAILLMEEAIEHDWQGVVFDATPERYRKWKDAHTPTLPFATAPTAPTTAATNPDSIWEDGRFYTLADFQATEEGRKFLGGIEGEWQEKILAEEGGLLRYMGIWEPLSDHPEYAKQNNK